MTTRCLAAFCLFAVTWNAMAQERRPEYAITDPRHLTEVIARVGPLTITAQRFLLSYEFGPGFVKRHPESRRHQLDFMINEQLMALEGYHHGLDTTRQVREFVGEIEGDVATEELYKDDVLSGVKVDEEEIAAGMERDQRHVSLSWLFCRTRDEADRLASHVADQRSYDSTFTARNTDSVSQSAHSMSTTRFKMSLDAPDFAAAVDTLAPGMTSPPIKGADGYYLVRIAAETRTALLSQSDAVKSRGDVTRALTQHKADSLSGLYIRRIMESAAPVIQRSAFDRIVEWLGSKYLRPDDRAAWNIGRASSDTVIQTRAGDTLVVSRARTFRVRDFLAWYRTRELSIRLSRSSASAFRSSVEQMVWRMVRDRLLAAKARHKGLQKRASVVSQKKWWEEKMLYELEKASIARTIPADRSTAKETYDAELSRRMLHHVLELKRKYSVTVDTTALARLPVDEENQPRVIDVYAAKTGGIFPHQAFPTIDLFWQSWE